MRIKSIEIQNYKSLKHIRVDNLSSLSIFVGANGSGKTNFADALDFLGLVFRDGLSKAITQKGGFENICYTKAKRASSMAFKIGVEYGDKEDCVLEYEFSIKLLSEEIFTDYIVDKDILKIRSNDNEIKGITIERENGKIKVAEANVNDLKLVVALTLINDIKDNTELKKDELMVVIFGVITDYFSRLLKDTLGNIRMYQIDPIVCRAGSVPTSGILGRHGENTATVFKIIMEKYPKVYERIQYIMLYIMPRLERINVKLNFNKTYSLEFKEEGVDRAWNADEISDGIIRILSMLLAIGVPDNNVVVIEEPENNIHPHLLVEFYEFCKEVSTYKQVIFTTHSITLLNELGENTDVYIVYRDDFSTIIKHIREFTGVEEDLEYETIGDLIFTGRIKEYLFGYTEDAKMRDKVLSN